MVFYTFAQHVNHAALADLAGEAGQELDAVDVLRVMGILHGQLFEGVRLGDAQKCKQLIHIKRMGAVIVFGAARKVAGAAHGGLRHPYNIGGWC